MSSSGMQVRRHDPLIRWCGSFSKVNLSLILLTQKMSPRYVHNLSRYVTCIHAHRQTDGQTDRLPDRITWGGNDVAWPCIAMPCLRQLMTCCAVPCDSLHYTESVSLLSRNHCRPLDVESLCASSHLLATCHYHTDIQTDYRRCLRFYSARRPLTPCPASSCLPITG